MKYLKKISQKTMTKNNKDELWDLNRRINCSKLEEIKSIRGDEEIWEENMNKSQKIRKRRVCNIWRQI